MSILQFLRIIWAHRMLILGTTIATMIGAVLAILLVPPNYVAHTRVMLNTLKPNPVTGAITPDASSRTYIATQIELIKDYGVVGEAVESLGWASNPQFVAQYNRAPNHEVVDIRRWLSQRIIDHTEVKALPGTNILEISYGASTPNESKAMADALRNAYLDSVLQNHRKEATQTADWYTQQAAQEQAALNAAQEAQSAYEKANGIIMASDNTDLDTARLRALSGQSSMSPVIPQAAPALPASIELAQLDAQIAQAAQNLGPNHPQMIAMKARRAVVAQVAAQDMAAQRAMTAAAAGAGAGALDRAVAQAESRVLAKRDKIGRLNQLAAEVNLRKEQYGHSLERIATLRKEAALADTGVSGLGDAATPQKPKWPNIPLVLGGAFGLGMALGVLASILVELFAWRVRGPEDLGAALDVPTLGCISTKVAPRATQKLAARKALPRLGRKRPATT